MTVPMAPWRLGLAIALPLIAVAVAVVLANRVSSAAAHDPGQPLAVPVVFQPGSTTAGCAALDAALPADLDGHPRRPMVAAEPGVAAWGDPAVILRCGISDPEELNCGSELTVFNGVSWLPLTGTGSTTYVAVDRASRVALTLDDSVGVGAVQALSNAIRTVMPERAVCVDGVLNPVDAP
jgi:hypothetical protein